MSFLVRSPFLEHGNVVKPGNQRSGVCPVGEKDACSDRIKIGAYLVKLAWSNQDWCMSRKIELETNTIELLTG